jgi:hypothetical protein
MRKKKSLSLLVWCAVVLIVGGGIAVGLKTTGRPAKLDGFARCLGDKGARFFGAFWCPHCQNQKAMFGRSASLLPYTECSTPDGAAQTAICTENKIESYPTWEFADGSRETGEVSLTRLAEKTGCALPQ